MGRWAMERLGEGARVNPRPCACLVQSNLYIFAQPFFHTWNAIPGSFCLFQFNYPLFS